MNISLLKKILKEYDKKIDSLPSIKDASFTNYLHKERHNIVRLFYIKNNINVKNLKIASTYSYRFTKYYIEKPNLNLNYVKALRKLNLLGTGQEFKICRLDKSKFVIKDREYL